MIINVWLRSESVSSLDSFGLVKFCKIISLKYFCEYCHISRSRNHQYSSKEKPKHGHCSDRMKNYFRRAGKPLSCVIPSPLSPVCGQAISCNERSENEANLHASITSVSAFMKQELFLNEFLIPITGNHISCGWDPWNFCRKCVQLHTSNLQRKVYKTLYNLWITNSTDHTENRTCF
jgi:hypothetical protein